MANYTYAEICDVVAKQCVYLSRKEWDERYQLTGPTSKEVVQVVNAYGWKDMYIKACGQMPPRYTEDQLLENAEKYIAKYGRMSVEKYNQVREKDDPPSRYYFPWTSSIFVNIQRASTFTTSKPLTEAQRLIVDDYAVTHSVAVTGIHFRVSSIYVNYLVNRKRGLSKA